MFYLRNRINPNLYRYSSEEDKRSHQEAMDIGGFEIYREWETKSPSGRIHYFCEYKEVGKA